MDRPTILLAITDQPDPYRAALERAGFEPLTVDPTNLAAMPAADVGVIDCDLPAEAVIATYQRLNAMKATPTTAPPKRYLPPVAQRPENAVQQR